MAKTLLAWLKPGVNRRVHLLLASLLWTGIGLLLVSRGVGWMEGNGFWWLMLAAFLAGTLKSLVIIDRSFRRGVERIMHLRDGTCLGAVYSWKTWLLVLLMMSGGMILRHLTGPGQITGLLYASIGWSLLFSSRLGWLRWLEVVRHA